MEVVYHTLQEFYTHTKAISYLLMVAALIVIALLWNFMAARDGQE